MLLVVFIKISERLCSVKCAGSVVKYNRELVINQHSKLLLLVYMKLSEGIGLVDFFYLLKENLKLIL